MKQPGPPPYPNHTARRGKRQTEGRGGGPVQPMPGFELPDDEEESGLANGWPRRTPPTCATLGRSVICFVLGAGTRGGWFAAGEGGKHRDGTPPSLVWGRRQA